jgi:hypothetical protein
MRHNHGSAQNAEGKPMANASRFDGLVYSSRPRSPNTGELGGERYFQGQNARLEDRDKINLISSLALLRSNQAYLALID